MANAGTEVPQAFPKDLRHAYGIAAGVLLPSIDNISTPQWNP